MGNDKVATKGTGMSKEKYTWETRADKEIWGNDRFDTVEECVKDALESGIEPGTMIAVGICEDFIPKLDADSALDKVSDDAYEECGEVAEGWPCFESRKGYYRVDELQEALDRVFLEWLEKTNQTPGFYHILPLADLVEVKEVKG